MELLGIIALLMFGWQRSLYYIPIEYQPGWEATIPAQVVKLEADTSQGRQFSFYWPPRAAPAAPPERLWVMFSGNAGVGLGWGGFIERFPDEHTGFLLIDYPGYGASEGYPTSRSILEMSLAMLDAVQTHLGVDLQTLDVGYLGHSMGVAAALQCAVVRPPNHLLLLSGFTTLPEETALLVGWPMSMLVLDRYDNIARLRELETRDPRPTVILMHGDQDQIVPVAMGRRLAALAPDWIRYRELPGADHFGFLFYQENLLFDAILGRLTP